MALGGSAARRYAEALLEVAGEEVAAVAAYRGSLDRLAERFGPKVLRGLRDRRAPLRERLEAVDRLTQGEPSAIRGVARMLVRRDRIGMVGDIARAYGDLVDRREGIVKGKITSPVELDEPARADLVARIERVTGKRIRATFATDPSLIGGLTIQLGDHLIDASVRAQLASLRERLAGA